MNHPMQPIEKYTDGVLRFKRNAIICYLKSNGLIDLNAIALIDFSNEDRQQLMQLLGYSIDGYADLFGINTDDLKCSITDN